MFRHWTPRTPLGATAGATASGRRLGRAPGLSPRTPPPGAAADAAAWAAAWRHRQGLPPGPTARDAAKNAQNERLTQMVMAARAAIDIVTNDGAV